VLKQDGNRLSGQMNLAGWLLGRVAAMTGTVQSDGSMTLQGGDSWPAIPCQPAGSWQIVLWNGRHDVRTDTISGDFTFVTQKHLSSCYYTPDLMVNATNMSLSRGNIPDESFAGHWQGTYAVPRCTPVGWSTCYPSPPPTGEVSLDLQLTQSGTAVSGTATVIPISNSTPFPVNGTIAPDGSSLVLTGSRTWPSSNGTDIVRLTSWSTTRDTIGRLQGTFSYIEEYLVMSGPDQGRTLSTSYDAELRNVIRVPW
jgi:hypothetical protein